MKKVFFCSLIILFLAPALAAFGQKNVFVSKSVLKTAEWAEVKYKDVVKRSVTGDQNAILALYDFGSLVDGVEAVEHTVTCLEIIPLASDDVVAHAIVNLHPNLKKAILDRIIPAQGKTEKVELKQAMNTWAPLTWDVLNGRPLPVPPVDEAMQDKLQNTDLAPGSLSPSDAGAQPDQLAPPAGDQPNMLAPPAGSQRNTLTPPAGAQPNLVAPPKSGKPGKKQ